MTRASIAEQICIAIVRRADEVASAAAEPLLKAVLSAGDNQHAKDILQLVIATLVAAESAAVAASCFESSRN